MSQRNFPGNLHDLSVKQLKVIAKHAKLRVHGMRKSEIIASINAHNNNNEEEVKKIKEDFKSRPKSGQSFSAYSPAEVH